MKRLAVVFLQLTYSVLIALKTLVLVTLGMHIAVKGTVLMLPGRSDRLHREFAQFLRTATKGFPLMLKLTIPVDFDTKLQHCML